MRKSLTRKDVEWFFHRLTGALEEQSTFEKVRKFLILCRNIRLPWLQAIWLATTFSMSYHPWKEISGIDPGIFAQEGPT